MTVLELFRKYDFESILPHLDHLFEVNSGRHFSDASIEVFRGLYKKMDRVRDKTYESPYPTCISLGAYKSFH
jgi:hypothetical protein